MFVSKEGPEKKFQKKMLILASEVFVQLFEETLLLSSTLFFQF